MSFFNTSIYIYTLKFQKQDFMWRYFFWEENRKWRWGFCFAAPSFIFLLNLLKPLKGDIITYNYTLNYFIAPFFFFFLIFYFFSFIIPKHFPKYFTKLNWTIKRFYIWALANVIGCSVLSFIYDYYFNNVNNIFDWGVKYYFQYQLPILIFSMLPFLAFFLLFDPYSNSKNNELTTLNTQIIELDLENGYNEVVLQIKDTNQRIELSINLESLYYFKASDNYIEIFHKNTEGVNRVVIRNTLKDIENQFSDIPQLFRCHKAYIVNTDKVKYVSGNAKGYFLTLEDVSEKIPVSRGNIEAMKKCLPSFF